MGNYRNVKTDYIDVTYDLSQHRPVLEKVSNICTDHYNAILAR